MKILIIIEHDNKTLKSANLHALTAAKMFAGEIDLLIAGYECDQVVEQTKKLPGIHSIFLANAKEYQHQLAENIASLIAEIGKTYDVILAAATTAGKNVLPRAAALLDTAMISDVTRILSTDTFVRPIYAGNAFATVKSHAKIKILTVRTTAFPLTVLSEHNYVTVQTISEVFPNSFSEFKDQQLTTLERPELISARIVVSGGTRIEECAEF